MRDVSKAAGIAAAVLALMAAGAPAALASGKAAGGGATGGGGGGGGGTVSTGGGGGTGSGGGGGGGGGGTNSGGTTDVVPTPGCVTLTSASAPVGYFSTWAAIWHDYAFRSCLATGNETVTLTVTDTNIATGLVDFTTSVPATLTPGQNAGGVIDNDFAPFSVDYTVRYDITDATGAVVASATMPASTPPAL